MDPGGRMEDKRYEVERLREEIKESIQAIESLEFDVSIEGDGSPEEFQEIHQAVMATSPNYFNIGRPIRLNGELMLG